MATQTLLETTGLRLQSDRIVDKDGVEYFIKDMKSASMKKGGFLKADSLLIELKNGGSKEFFFRSTTTPLRERVTRGMIAQFTMGGRGVLMTVERDIQTQIAEWAVNINKLIDAYKSNH